MTALATRPAPELAVVTPPQRADLHPVRVFLASLSPSTCPGVERTLQLVADTLSGNRYRDVLTFPWARLRYQHVQAIRTYLGEHYAPRTANKMLTHLRGVLGECWRLGYTSAEDYHRAIDVKPVVGSGLEQAAGRMLTQGEMTALVNAAVDGTVMGWRDLGILAVLFGGGLRRSEVVGLKVEDLEWAEDHVRLTVVGKRRKVRTTYLTGGAFQALKTWLQVRGDWPGAVFVAGRCGGHVTRARMTEQAVYYTCQKLARRAKVQAWTPHDARRTMISQSLDAGCDVFGLQRQVGHASPTTTSQYDRRGERAKLKAASAISFPWSGRSPEAA